MQFKYVFLAVATAAFLPGLIACGGGGADSTVQAPVATESNLIMTLPASPYVSGTPEKRTFDEINRVRIAGGFGAAMHDASMDKSAKAHTSYLLANPTGGDAHNEIAGNPGFTGVVPQDRCDVADVGNNSPMGKLLCGENVGSVAASSGVLEINVLSEFTYATGHLQNALNYRNNLAGMNFQRYTKSGVESIFGVIPSIEYITGVMQVGYRMNFSARLASDKTRSIVGVYPFDGMTGVGIGLDLTNGKIQPISILVQSSRYENPIVTSFTLRKDGAITDTPSVVHQAGTPFGPEPTAAGWAILYPTVLLEMNSKYTAKFNGSIDGVPVSKTWTFTTGANGETRLDN